MPIVDDITMRMLVAPLGPHGVGEVVVVSREIHMHVRNHVGIVPRPKAQRGKRRNGADDAKEKIGERQAHRCAKTSGDRIGDQPAGMRERELRGEQGRPVDGVGGTADQATRRGLGDGVAEAEHKPER